MNTPRFVWLVGAANEDYPDTPPINPADGVLLWDRERKEPVVTLHPNYAGLICLENTDRLGNQPFTDLEEWANAIEPSFVKEETGL